MEPPRSLSKDKDKETNSEYQKKRKLPTAQELIAYYESQGMESKEASVKVIEDLQKALFFRITSSSSSRGISNSSDTKKKMVMAETSRKQLDVINARLINLEMKLDSKPGYPQTLAIGVASGATLRGLGTLFPHVAAAFSHIWNAVRSITTKEGGFNPQTLVFCNIGVKE
ncbi:hypothetical protein LOK49_LG14G02266 [Camellia lanceoleosa]|uniref:Uncharacterized protein n=1 Tax=Camellia lanceoleosa TaxID=1840588 RepID=A0ACC0FDY7_9ERIC|nr:hypothetical protein LOK49_LG14G02266 [Camellia lanceoleosa]